jgi:tetratricopeptide (TPR) repeat protein/tRNA A-37 threonylcarbamoyl transferase component Bud32
MDPREVVTVPDRGDDATDAPTRIGHFEIVGRLGSGGMGVVFEGRDAVLGRRVALKVLHPSNAHTAPARLLREAQALAKLSHPNVVAIFEVGLAGTDPFIAMELVEGETLLEWMRTPHEWREVLDVFIAVGHGLAAGHALGLVHRDFKPSNVMFDKRGVPKLGDFGLVGATNTDDDGMPLVASDTLTVPGSVMGTPAYMAPEQAIGEAVDARADQFSFAKTLREVVGKPMPAVLEPIIERAMSLEPDDRYPNMDALLDELARIRRGNRRTWIAAGITASIIGAAAIAWGIGHATTAEEDPCPAPRARIAAAWSTSRAVALTSLAQTIDPRQGAARIAAATRLLDPYADRWQSFAVETCKATRVEHTQSDTVFDLRMRCLDRRLSALSGSVQRIATSADPDQLEASIGALSALATIESCADTERMTRELDLPTEPAARAAAEALATRIEAIALDGSSDRLNGLLDRARAAVADARKLGHPGTLAAALTTLTRSQTTTNETTDLETTLRELTQVAAKAHRDVDEAVAWTELILIVGSEEGRPDEGLAFATAASAAVLRAGDPVEWRTRLLLAQAIVLDTTPKIKDGIAILADARALLVKNGAERADSPLAELFADVLLETAEALDNADESDKAIPVYREAIERYRVVRGPDSTAEAITLHNLGVALGNVGKPDEAIASFREAARINELRAGGSARLGSNLLSIASTLGDQGKWDQSLATYDRAVELLRDKSDGNPQQLGGLLLGRATARKHAGRLAEARAGFDEAIAVFERAGAVGSNLPIARYNRAELSIQEERWADAIVDNQQAAIEFEKFDTNTRRLGYPLLGLGHALVMAKRPAEAIAPLERAVPLWEKNPSMLGQSKAWLARALAETKGDRARIEKLTAETRATLRSVPDDESAAAALKDFERWIARR